jgi:hypothetical protein
LLDQLSVAGDPEVFASVEQELLVDKIAENIFFAVSVAKSFQSGLPSAHVVWLRANHHVLFVERAKCGA